MESHVYVLVHAKQPRLKIGKANDVFCRLLGLGLSKLVDVKRSFAVRARSADEAFKLERHLHKELAAWRLGPEDFPSGGYPSKGFTEWFKDECLGNARKVVEEAARQDSSLRMLVFTETMPVEEAGCDLAQLSAEQLLRKLMAIGNATRYRESAYEKGMRFRQALETGIVSSRLHLAASTGHSIGEVSRAIQIASLPAKVIGAFPSPSDIHFRWAKPLKDACQCNLPAVLEAVEHLKSKPELTADQVLAHLVTAASIGKGGVELSERRLEIAGKPVVLRASGKHTLLQIDARLLPKERWGEFEKALRTLLE